MVRGLARHGVLSHVPDRVLFYISLYGIGVLQEARSRRRTVLCFTSLDLAISKIHS